ncbi:MAG: hypothetical protein QXO97_08710 [Candidatus Nezhaarchaeales archaeon]
MSLPRIISIRRHGVALSPTIIRVKTYPVATAELLTKELAIQYMRALRLTRRKVNQLIIDFLDGKVSDYELRKEYLRLAQEANDIAQAVLALINFSYLIEDIEDSIKLIERIIIYLCRNKNGLNDFSRILLRNIINNNLTKIYNYKKTLKQIYKSVKEKLVELQIFMNIFGKQLKISFGPAYLQRLDEIAALYVQYSWALNELRAIRLSMNIGLIDFQDELLKMMNEIAMLRQLRAQLRLGELNKDEYIRQVEKSLESIQEIELSITEKIEKFKVMKTDISRNEDYLQKILGRKTFLKLKRMMDISELSIQKINNILSKSKVMATLEED